jgi:hypothetical protein
MTVGNQMKNQKWDSYGVVDHTEDRTCQLLSYVGTSTLHPKYPKSLVCLLFFLFYISICFSLVSTVPLVHIPPSCMLSPKLTANQWSIISAVSTPVSSHSNFINSIIISHQQLHQAKFGVSRGGKPGLFYYKSMLAGWTAT